MSFVFIAALSENHKKEVESLNTRIKELTAQVAWLNRQLFGRKSEKLGIIDPAQLNLFADIQSEQAQEANDARNEAVGCIIGTDNMWAQCTITGIGLFFFH